MTDLKTKLQADLLEASWDALAPHARRGALLFVSPSLPLVQAGIALANDDTHTVSTWISQQLLVKPSPEQLELLALQPQQLFQTLIVQPFVLVQENTPPNIDA